MEPHQDATEVAVTIPVPPKVTATFTLHGQTVTCPVLNPGDHYGTGWAFEIGGSFVPRLVYVEGDDMMDATENLLCHADYESEFAVDKADLPDYLTDWDIEGDPVYDHIWWNANGKPCDLQHLATHGGRDGFTVRYFADHLPANGIDCDGFDDYLNQLRDRVYDDAIAIDPDSALLPLPVLADWWDDHGRPDYATAIRLGLAD